MKKLRVIIDIGMTAVLLGLMAYSLIGELMHEILGTAMIILFTAHHVLNRRWFGVLLKANTDSFAFFRRLSSC
jgi:hypothetical protein